MGVESTHMALGCVSRCELKCCLKHAGEQKELPVSLPLRTQQMHWKEAALLQSKQLLSPPLLSDRTMLARRLQLTQVMHFPPVPANAQNPRVPAREFSEGIARAGVPERIVSAAWPTHQTPARGTRSSKGGASSPVLRERALRPGARSALGVGPSRTQGRTACGSLGQQFLRHGPKLPCPPLGREIRACLQLMKNGGMRGKGPSGACRGPTPLMIPARGAGAGQWVAKPSGALPRCMLHVWQETTC